ncbi:MAG TPA: hypothetical protein VGD40_06755 [Chryseosolibacter sp.]
MPRSIVYALIAFVLFSCTEEDPIKVSLVNLVDEAPGGNCEAGGLKIETGFDNNNDQILSTDEVLQTKYVCSAETDKQLRLEIGAPNFGTNETNFVLSQFETYHLIKFNKLHYSNVESIIFTPSMYASKNSMFPSETTTCVVELYNVTDGVSIANSQLSSDVDQWIFKESGNLYDALPAKEVTLGIRVRTTNPNLYASTGIRSYLFINKN